MTVLEVFEKVNLKTPIEQRRFFNYYNDSVSELTALYAGIDRALLVSGDFVPIASLDDESAILPLYHEAMVDNILFLSGQDETYKGEFIRKARDAYLKYWNDKAKGRRVRRVRW